LILADYSNPSLTAGDSLDLYVEITTADGTVGKWYRTSYQPGVATDGSLKVDVNTIKTRTVTAANPITFPSSIGTSTFAGGAVASVTNGVTLAANQDVRNVSGTLPTVQVNAATGWGGSALPTIGTSTVTTAQVLEQAIAALVDANLDHLAKTAVTTGMPEVVDNTILSQMMTAAGDTSTYTPASASLMALSIKTGGLSEEDTIAAVTAALGTDIADYSADPASVAGLVSSTSGVVGPGGTAFTVTVRDTLSNPLAAVSVWVTSDLAGTNTIAGTLMTDALGNVVFMLPTGTAYIWRMSPIYTFPNPKEIDVP
jgi:hypothetical protein